MSQTTIDDNVEQQLIEARTKLMKDDAHGFYLGKSTVVDHVVWRQVGCTNQLVTKASALAVDRAMKKRLKDGGQPLYEPAKLSVIVVVDHGDCWLTPCGHWEGPGSVPTKFEDLKLHFNAKKPAQTFLAMDFDDAWKNGVEIMKVAARRETKTGGFLVQSKSELPVFRFRHKVFEPLRPASVNLEPASEGMSHSSILDWPVKSPVARDELVKMASTHRSVPLPAYDKKGDLIQPQDCEEALVGAIVRVTFTLTHWFIRNKVTGAGTNQFVADIQSIRVLVEPMVLSVSSGQRYTALHDPEDDTLRKKARII